MSSGPSRKRLSEHSLDSQRTGYNPGLEVKAEPLVVDDATDGDSMMDLQEVNSMEPFGDLDSVEAIQTIDSIADIESRDPLDGYQVYTSGPGGEHPYAIKEEALDRKSSDYHEIMLDGTDDESRYLRAGDESEDDHFSSSETLRLDPEAPKEMANPPRPVDHIAPITPAAESFSSWTNRFEVVLEASTAVAQGANDDPLSYLNKCQKYNIVFRDKEQVDEMFSTSLCVCFHELKYQREEEATWKIWLAGQSSPTAKPIDLDRKSSIGISQVDCSMFNTILFSWNGKKGATVAIKISCLSTEFIKCKGVKGVQLRLQSQIRDSHNQLESSCCRIKVFRDKGAERKNRDDQKSLERKMEKIFKDNPNAKITINPPKPRTVFTTTTNRDPHFTMGSATTGRRVESVQSLAPASGPAHPLTAPSPAPPAKVPATVFLMTTFPSGSSTKPTHQSVLAGLPNPIALKTTPSPSPLSGTPVSSDDSKGQLPRHASMPNLSNLAIVSQTSSTSHSPHNTFPVPSPSSTPGITSGPGSHGTSHSSGHSSGSSHGHSHTHLHHSHHPHASHPYMLAIGHSHTSHHPHGPHHGHHSHHSRSSHSRSSSFSSTHSPPSEEISPASSNSSRANSPTDRLPSSFGIALPGIELKAHQFSDIPLTFRRRLTEDELGPSEGELENEIRRRKRPALCLLLQKTGEDMFTAVYLEEPTVEELKSRVSEKFQLDPQQIRTLTRVSKKGLSTKVDNAMLEHTEQDEGFQLEVLKDEVAGTFSLVFHSL